MSSLPGAPDGWAYRIWGLSGRLLLLGWGLQLVDGEGASVSQPGAEGHLVSGTPWSQMVATSLEQALPHPLRRCAQAMAGTAVGAPRRCRGSSATQSHLGIWTEVPPEKHTSWWPWGERPNG